MQEVREVVDPIDQTTDLANAVSWVYGEPQCDRERIGLWGSSYSGGHVVYVAARDPRVKATVSQVPALDSRPMMLTGSEQEKTFAEAAARTHGELGYPPPGARVIGNLRGAPMREKLMQYAPVEDVARAPNCAMLFVLAENEELFDNKDHGLKAHRAGAGPEKAGHRAQDQALRHLHGSPQAGAAAGHRLVRRAPEKSGQITGRAAVE